LIGTHWELEKEHVRNKGKMKKIKIKILGMSMRHMNRYENVVSKILLEDK
jgi:hypothetical protein